MIGYSSTERNNRKSSEEESPPRTSVSALNYPDTLRGPGHT